MLGNQPSVLCIASRGCLPRLNSKLLWLFRVFSQNSNSTRRSRENVIRMLTPRVDISRLHRSEAVHALSSGVVSKQVMKIVKFSGIWKRIPPVVGVHQFHRKRLEAARQFEWASGRTL